ncbi:MAG: glycosyltransferase family 39 protein [Chloroherpetonaceae bacterium]|nr:glycosyltransferase family 39 protein [Chthonomonadaceae bacterium]MDW8208055.1 glycosyltransferase family 39 protein [Chloroherpetonaceae bacterium]
MKSQTATTAGTLSHADAPSVARTGWMLFLFGTLTAALFAFVIYPRQGAIDAVIDVNGFGSLARRIANGEGFSLGYGPTMRRAPLYPAFAALLMLPFGTQGPPAEVYRPVIAGQCLIFGLSCVVCWTIARKLFGPRAGLIAGILCAITPQTLRYVGMTEVETMMGLFIALMALTGLNFARETTFKNAVWFGMACAGASLLKAVALLYPFVFAALLAVRWWRTRKTAASADTTSQDRTRPHPLAAAGVALAVYALCLAPWCIRNYIVSGGQFKSISTNGPGEFLRGYVMAQPKYVFLQKDFGGHESDMIWDVEANLVEDAILRRYGLSMFSQERRGPNGEPLPLEPRIDNEVRKDRAEAAEVKRLLREEPAGFVRKFAMQFFSFWYVVETRKKSLIVGAIALIYLSLAIFGCVRARRAGIDTAPVYSVVLYFNVIYAAILAFARYSMPVYPTLIALTAIGLAQLLPARLREPQTRRNL